MKIDQFDLVSSLKHLDKGDLSAQALVSQCLEAIEANEPQVQAWQYHDPEYALQQAIKLDKLRQSGRLLGALHGIPIAIKDIFATQEMPTEWGTPIHEGRMLNDDAAVVELLRSAGAVILGKTVTTEYAMAAAGKTINPHHPNHTPGGSSSGSAAAVASGMAPVAIGSQTMGSVLRPAAYCGVLGFKPSFGSISRYGAMMVSRELDHVGLFARIVADLSLLYSVLAVPDGRDPDCTGAVSTPSVESSPPMPPSIALIRTHLWSQVEPEAQERLLESAAILKAAGAKIADVTLPAEFDSFLEQVHVLAYAGLAVNHGKDYDDHRDRLSTKLQLMIEQGRTQTPLDYASARQIVCRYSLSLTALFTEFDAILTPVTTGTAPYGLADTGSPVLCALWTLCGLPAISIPAGTAANGLPLAVQLVGQRGRDRELLKIAEWAIGSSDRLG